MRGFSEFGEPPCPPPTAGPPASPPPNQISSYDACRCPDHGYTAQRIFRDVPFASVCNAKDRFETGQDTGLPRAGVILGEHQYDPGILPAPEKPVRQPPAHSSSTLSPHGITFPIRYFAVLGLGRPSPAFSPSMDNNFFRSNFQWLLPSNQPRNSNRLKHPPYAVGLWPAKQRPAVAIYRT